MNRHVADGHGRVLEELAKERLAALTRISTTLEGILGELHRLRDRIAHMSGEERAATISDYEALRSRARTYRWYLDVQREAIGLRHHRIVDEVYDIPGRVV